MAMSFRSVRNLGLGILLVVIFSVSIFSYVIMSRSTARLTEIVTVIEIKLRRWDDMVTIITEAKDSLDNYRSGRSEVIAPAILLINKATKEIETIKELTTDEYELLITAELIEEIKKFKQAVFGYWGEVREGYRGGTSAKEMEAIAVTAASSIVQLGRAAMSEIHKKNEEENMAILNITNAAQEILWMTLIAAIALSVIIAILMARALRKPIDRLVIATQKLARGDLTYRLKVDSKDEIGQLAISFNEMANDLQQGQEQLEHKAFHDQLTNLPNRSLFTKHLERIVAKHFKRQKDYQFAVLFMDLDRFKIINDSMGHLVGDQLLIETAQRLENCTRSTDIVSRFSGDEFAMLIDDFNDMSEVTMVADRVKDELALPFNLRGQEVFITASIGIAVSETGYEKVDDILRDADSAMYRAKNLGRARYEIFDSEMHATAVKLFKLESDLRTAVGKEQFMVYYQPIVSSKDGRIISVEALIRWQHPERGFVPPMEFIPLAEDTGLILPIGEWILRTACAQNKAWQDAGYQHLHIGVNFSSYQFKHKNIPELIKKILHKTGMPAQSLNVEITESIAMEEYSIEAFNKISVMGVQISIDDFGTGFSSLGSLKRFPINIIKIDRFFVKEIAKDPKIESIVRAIIVMAHSLNMGVVAEGVETEEQLAFLSSHKCDKMQGYLFSPPVPADKFEKLLKKGYCLSVETTDKKTGFRDT